MGRLGHEKESENRVSEAAGPSSGSVASPGVSSPTSITGEPVDPEHLGLALRSVAAGSMAGLGLVSAALWLVRTLQATGAAPREPGPTDFVANLILFGWIGAGMRRQASSRGR